MSDQKKYNLLILESPTKARTVSGYLKDQNFKVIASRGHLLELPKKSLGLDLNTFEMTIAPIEGKEDVINEIKRLAKDADQIYLGSDYDSEGERISFDINSLISNSKNKKNIHRVVFTEITKKAILAGIQNIGSIDLDKCNAQKTRRILDRLVGYKISPILWEKLGSLENGKPLSSGRVQSVALRFIVDLENEIKNFVPEKFFQIVAKLQKNDIVFDSKYFGESEDKKTDLNADNEVQARQIFEDIKNQNFIVSKVETKEKKIQPSPPFSTSRLQQEASNKLKFDSKTTMTHAQSLFEGLPLGDKGTHGLITYHRTSSVTTSDDALKAVREFIQNKYGSNYLPSEAIIYKKKKSADDDKKDPHEAIRPTNMEYTPDSIRSFLSNEQFKLYQLIWNKYVSSQMLPAVLDQTSVIFDVAKHFFRSVGSVVKFDGFKAVYVDGDEVKDDGEDGDLPKLDLKESLTPIEPPRFLEKFTSPPSRLTEGGLVKLLEERKIGRSSTYAAIISNIVDRQYVKKIDNRFHPTQTGITLCNFLVNHFSKEMEYNFTVDLEKKLDLIEDGKLVWLDVLTDFWKGLSATIEKTKSSVESVVKAPRTINPASRSGIICSKCNTNEMIILRNKDGEEFLGCSGYPICKQTSAFKKNKKGEVSLVEKKETYHKNPCHLCQSQMVLREGKFGPYFTCSTYPVCKATRQKGLDVSCPDCKVGEFVKIKTKTDSVFYGCSEYRNGCKNSMNHEPIEDPCPSCQYAVRGMNKIDKKTKELICPKCKNVEVK